MNGLKHLIKSLPFAHKYDFWKGLAAMSHCVEMESKLILAQANELHSHYVVKGGVDRFADEVFELNCTGWADTTQSTLLKSAADLYEKCMQIEFLAGRFEDNLGLMLKLIEGVYSRRNAALDLSKVDKTVIATFAAQYSQLQGLCSSIKSSAHMLDYEISQIKESHKTDQ